MTKINIEDEKIYVGDVWKSTEILKEEIKGKIEIGNFDITDEALALKQLTSTMHQYTRIELKLPNDFIAASREKADETGISFEEYLRKRLSDGNGEGEKAGEEEEAVEEEKEEEEDEQKEEEAEGEDEEEEEEKEEAEEVDEQKEEEKEKEKEDEEKAARPDWENEEEEETAVPQQIVKVRCHNCKKPITITSSERPITVTCPNCGAKGRLEQ